MGGGLHMPDATSLDKVRLYLINHEEEFRDIYYSKDINNTFGEFDNSNKLKNVPRGFDKTSSAAEFLKLKTFTLGAKVDTQNLSNSEFVELCIEKFKSIYPLTRYMNAALKK